MFLHSVRRRPYGASVLESGLDDTPLVEDVHAIREGGPDGSGLVVVEGVWGGVPGGPPPVLIVDDGTRRHTIAALDGPPPDDPMAFRARFAIPAELVDRLGEGLALGVGRTEVPLRLTAGGSGDGSWLQGPPFLAARLGEEPGPADAPVPGEAPEDDLPMPPMRRFRGEVMDRI